MSTPKKPAARSRKTPAKRSPSKTKAKPKTPAKRPISAKKKLHGRYMGLLNGVSRNTQRKARALAKAGKKPAAVALLEKAHAA